VCVLRRNAYIKSAGYVTLTFSPLWRKKDPLARLMTDEDGEAGGSESMSGRGSETSMVLSGGALKVRAGLKAPLRKVCPAVRKPKTGSPNIVTCKAPCPKKDAS
jgi:hypothetical protein